MLFLIGRVARWHCPHIRTGHAHSAAVVDAIECQILLAEKLRATQLIGLE
ncbi:MAG: hypothetical protein K8F35_14780 [Dokdonella sp.]|nr:hypothetical protein [Dokdonella sp.]MBZ0224278.1 hypothetical protein [Dokdonella sp.]